MSNIFADFNTEGLEQVTDSLGGGYTPLETGVYPMTIKTVYITYSKKGAMAANLVGDIDGREYREQLWLTDSEGKNYYKNKKTGGRVALPGLTHLNDICLCALGQELKDLDAEPRAFKIYNFETKQEETTSVPTIIDLMGQNILVGIVKQIVDKKVKDPAGSYVPSGETREENVIDKVFHSSKKLTVYEARTGKTEAEFYNKWVAKKAGKTINKAKGKAEGTAGAPQKTTAASKPLIWD